MTTIVLAVFTALGSLRVAANSNKAILNQALAGNAWAYFQAKSIKEHSFELQRDLLLAQLTHIPDVAKPHYDERVQKCTKEVARYKKEKNDIEKEAKSFETVPTMLLKRKDQFANSTTILQVAIMIASVGLVIKRAAMWGLSILLGVVGIAFYTNGYWLIFEPCGQSCQRVAPCVNRRRGRVGFVRVPPVGGARFVPFVSDRACREGIGEFRCVGEHGRPATFPGSGAPRRSKSSGTSGRNTRKGWIGARTCAP